MKRILILTAIFFVFACSSDDSSDTNDNNDNNNELLNCDGNPVPTIVYGTQEWTVENACHTTYRDGTPIPQVTDFQEWQNLTTGAWIFTEYEGNSYRLYNWYAINGINDNDPTTPKKEFAPIGWRVPNDNDWIDFSSYLIEGGFDYYEPPSSFGVNTLAKSIASNYGWIYSANEGVPGNNDFPNNTTGFNAIPYSVLGNDSGFNSFGELAIFWSVSESSSESINGNINYYGNRVKIERDWAQFYYLGDGDGFADWLYASNKESFFAVRLIKD